VSAHNTLFLQGVLSEPEWSDRLTEEDRRALTPLFWTHVNPGALTLLSPAAKKLIMADRLGLHAGGWATA